jgi:hypothetical protein
MSRHHDHWAYTAHCWFTTTSQPNWRRQTAERIGNTKSYTSAWCEWDALHCTATRDLSEGAHQAGMSHLVNQRQKQEDKYWFALLC